MQAPRFIKIDKEHPIVIVDTWNVPYSTGFYVLSTDDEAKETVEEFAYKNAHFPFWPLRYMGKLWAKDTWDD